MDDPLLITDRLYLINSATNGRFPMAFAFLVTGTDTHALIDTGCGGGVCREVMERHGVDVVINSHCHPDHISGNHLFQGKELWVPRQRADETGAIDRLAARLAGPDPAIMESWKHFAIKGVGLRDYQHTRTFDDGECLDFGGITLTALHTPGHLEDHYCFLEPTSNTLLSFDVDLTTFGPFYGNPEGDIPSFRASLAKIRALSPRVVASSHRMPVDEEVDRELENFGEMIDRNADRVKAALDAPRSLDELCQGKPLYGKYPPGLEIIYAFFERNMIEKHLAEMLDQGQVAFREGKYVTRTEG